MLTHPKIVHNDFPLPAIAASAEAIVPPAPVILPSNSDITPEAQPPSSTDKENALPRPPVPSFGAVIPSAREQPADSPLPRELYHLYASSRSTLESSFTESPPYTIQRLAELVLHPKKYYRHLPPFLAALDRVVSVTSPVNNFPLAQANIDAAGGFLANGDPSEALTEREGLGSDESLGGALLTPIPWLKRENGHHDFRSEGSQTIEGPNGTGLVETVSVSANGLTTTTTSEEEEPLSHEQALRAEGGVTQGELLRQEQEAGIVPVGQEVPRRTLVPGGTTSAVGHESTLAQEEEQGEKPEDHAHARGPEKIGAEDMGPQDTAIGVTRPLNMEAAAGRAKSPEATRDDKDAEGDSTISDIGDDEQLQTELSEQVEKSEQPEEPENPLQEAEKPEEQQDEAMDDI